MMQTYDVRCPCCKNEFEIAYPPGAKWRCKWCTVLSMTMALNAITKAPDIETARKIATEALP